MYINMENKVRIYTSGEGANSFHFDLSNERTKIVMQVLIENLQLNSFL
jgi:hypothetical protein